MRITAQQTCQGTWIARPATALGTAGAYPFPWTATVATSRTNAISKFKHEHAERIRQLQEAQR